MDSEAYELSVNSNLIRIAAGSEQGIIYALTTLVQLMENGTVKTCRVKDEPRYSHRGLSMDCARHFFRADEVKKVIEEISLAKMNVFHWHLTDDQGWRIESRKFPLLHTTGSEYYTQEEIKEICEFAKIRGVEIIPEIDMPGHVSSILAAYPDLSCSHKQVSLAKTGGIFPVILCAGNDKTYEFLNELWQEIFELFPGDRFHTGGDEAPKKEWKACPCCTKKMQDMGYTDYEQLQGYFASRINEIFKANGKTAVFWNETLRSVSNLENAEIQYWTLQHRDSMEKYADTKQKWIYSDMFELYFDYPYSMTNLKKVYETVPHLGMRQVDKSDGLQGMEAAIWAEHIQNEERLENLLFPRVYALAEILWASDNDYQEFEARLAENIKSDLHGNIAYTSRDWWTPEGQARQMEAFAYMKSMNDGMSEETKAETVESTAPNREFGEVFMTKFFQPEDLPILMAGMNQKA
ncbi:MAG: family 20 glycosylhydrolase [Eubacteriales bacterium]|nr:family 20 glycosylhydrolase [Eubacteriales bacterium]